MLRVPSPIFHVCHTDHLDPSGPSASVATMSLPTLTTYLLYLPTYLPTSLSGPVRGPLPLPSASLSSPSGCPRPHPLVRCLRIMLLCRHTAPSCNRHSCPRLYALTPLLSDAGRFSFHHCTVHHHANRTSTPLADFPFLKRSQPHRPQKKGRLII